ncbi:hypothetical protein BLOT_016240 [Blomia tropicalis]|nr:hypothetical protein BLOT_016240 [Blomia tropicalis]
MAKRKQKTTNFTNKSSHKTYQPNFQNFQRIEFDESLLMIRQVELENYFKQLSESNTKIITEGHLTQFVNTVSLNSKDRRKRWQILTYIKNVLSSKGFQCDLFYTGSTINQLGSYNSDGDVYMQLGSNSRMKRPKAAFLIIRSMLRSTKMANYYNFNVIPARTCPILKIESIGPHTMDFDINCTFPVGVFTSKVTQYIVNSNERIRKLFVILINWAKAKKLIQFLQFKSYTLSLMIIFFLQNHEHEFIRSIDSITHYWFAYNNHLPENFDKKSLEFPNLLQNLDRLPNTFDLIHQFFVFYHKFDYINFVISPNLGYPIRKDHFNDLRIQKNPKFDMKVFNKYLCVEDGIELCRNVMKSVHKSIFEQFIRFCTHYSSIPEHLFIRDRNEYIKFISDPIDRSVIPEIQSFILPCYCYIEKWNLVDASKDHRHQLCDFVFIYSKEVFRKLFEFEHIFKYTAYIKLKLKQIKYSKVQECYQFNQFQVAELKFTQKYEGQIETYEPPTKKQKVDSNVSRFWTEKDEDSNTYETQNERTTIVKAVCRLIGEKQFILQLLCDSKKKITESICNKVQEMCECSKSTSTKSNKGFAKRKN